MQLCPNAFSANHPTAQPQQPPQLLPPGDSATKRFSAPRTVTEHHWQLQCCQAQKNPKIQKIEQHGGNMWKSMFNECLKLDMLNIDSPLGSLAQIDRRQECSERRGPRGLFPMPNPYSTQYTLIICAVYAIPTFQYILIDHHWCHWKTCRICSTILRSGSHQLASLQPLITHEMGFHLRPWMELELACWPSEFSQKVDRWWKCTWFLDDEIKSSS